MIKTNTIKLNCYPFEGWDWSEFLKAWNIYQPPEFYYPDPENEYGFHPFCYEIDPIKWYLQGVMKQHKGQKVPRSMQKCAKDIRIFLSILGDPKFCNTYSGPMWLGMSKIKCDWTLVQFTEQLIGSMWD